MVYDGIEICKTAVRSCLDWFSSLISSIDGTGYIIAIFVFVFIVGMFLMPLRGMRVGANSYFQDHTKTKVNNKKRGD